MNRGTTPRGPSPHGSSEKLERLDEHRQPDRVAAPNTTSTGARNSRSNLGETNGGTKSVGNVADTFSNFLPQCMR